MSLSAVEHSRITPGPNQERAVFLQLLLHDDRNSFYILSTDEGGTWHDEPYRRDALNHTNFGPAANYYLTHNGFSGKRRQTERVRQVNALFFDIDCHGLGASQAEPLIHKAYDALLLAVEQNTLPSPTMIVHSGRGLHLYYVLQRSMPMRFTKSGEVNDKGLTLFQAVQNQLACLLDGILEPFSGLTVDRAVFDHTRVSRIPGTYNSKARRYAQLLYTDESFCHLSDLATYKATSQSTPTTKPSASQQPSFRVLTFNSLMMQRLRKVRELQEYRGFVCEGTRELMGFVYYNTAVQIYSRSDAVNQLNAFNQKYATPLPASEIAGIVHAVDTVVNVHGKRGYYILKAETLIRLLALSDKEMDDLQFFASKRVTERLEAKRKTQHKREQRNQKIRSLAMQSNMTRAQIAEECGCSMRTVASVLKKHGLTRAQLGSWGPVAIDDVMQGQELKLPRAFTKGWWQNQIQSGPQTALQRFFAEDLPLVFLSEQSAKKCHTSFCSDRGWGVFRFVLGSWGSFLLPFSLWRASP